MNLIEKYRYILFYYWASIALKILWQIKQFLTTVSMGKQTIILQANFSIKIV
jgi:hypothetical protein